MTWLNWRDGGPMLPGLQKRHSGDGSSPHLGYLSAQRAWQILLKIILQFDAPPYGRHLVIGSTTTLGAVAVINNDTGRTRMSSNADTRGWLAPKTQASHISYPAGNIVSLHTKQHVDYAKLVEYGCYSEEQSHGCYGSKEITMYLMDFIGPLRKCTLRFGWT